jgi:hypothetical protein
MLKKTPCTYAYDPIDPESIAIPVTRLLNTSFAGHIGISNPVVQRLAMTGKTVTRNALREAVYREAM